MFSVPSIKRDDEFHGSFLSVPRSERLVDTFSCALSKEILHHGRLYLSEAHLCFSSNILGWSTNVVLALSDIVSIEKRLTAFVIPNAIQISTLHHKYFFASFMWRDDAYEKIVLFWRNSLSEKPSSYVELLSYDYRRPSQRAAPSKHDEGLPRQVGGFSAQATASSMHRSVAAMASHEHLASDSWTRPASLRCGCKKHYTNAFVRDVHVKAVPSAFKAEIEHFFRENGHVFKHSFLSFNCSIQFTESTLADDSELFAADYFASCSGSPVPNSIRMRVCCASAETASRLNISFEQDSIDVHSLLISNVERILLDQWSLLLADLFGPLMRRFSGNSTNAMGVPLIKRISVFNLHAFIRSVAWILIAIVLAAIAYFYRRQSGGAVEKGRQQMHLSDSLFKGTLDELLAVLRESEEKIEALKDRVS